MKPTIFKPTTITLGATFLATAAIIFADPAGVDPNNNDPFGNNSRRAAKAAEKAKAAKASKPKQQKPAPPRNVRTQFQYIETSLETLNQLLADEKLAASDKLLRARLSELCTQDKARIIHTEMLTCPSGAKTSTESHREFIYPTEYEPAEIPNELNFHLKDGQTLKNQRHDIATGPTPTAFETQNLGFSHEVLPSIDDPGYISLDLAITDVHHIKNHVWISWKDERGQADIQMPMFYTKRISSNPTLTSGVPCLAATLTPHNAQGDPDYSRKILVFVTARIIEVKE